MRSCGRRCCKSGPIDSDTIRRKRRFTPGSTCLPARVALDAIGSRSARPQLYLSELTSAQRAELVEQEVDVSQTGVSASTRELEALQDFLGRLKEQDRQILLAFAEHEGRESWATSLAEQWQMPASTIRSKKRRVMLRLRDALTNQGFTLLSGEKHMCSLAPRPDQHAPAVRQAQRIALLPAQFAEYAFLQQNSEAVARLTAGLRDYLRVYPPDADPGLSHFAELWNRAGS